MTTQDDTTSNLIEAARSAFTAPFAAIIKIQRHNGTSIFVDGHQEPPSVSADGPNGEPDCIWSGEDDILLSILVGERALDRAYLAGRLTIANDMSVMARLNLAGAR